MIQLYIIKQIKLPGPLGLLVTSNLNYKITKQKHNNYSLDRYKIFDCLCSKARVINLAS